MGAACRTAEVTALDVVYALKRQGKTIYGFGDAARGTGHATLERRIAASPGVCVGYVGFFLRWFGMSLAQFFKTCLPLSRRAAVATRWSRVELGFEPREAVETSACGFVLLKFISPCRAEVRTGDPEPRQSLFCRK